jgi:hypothetical protein
MVDEHTSLLGVRCDLCGVLFLTLTHPQSAGAYPLTLQAWPLWLRPDFEHREDRPFQHYLGGGLQCAPDNLQASSCGLQSVAQLQM